MKWEKKGRIYCADNKEGWAVSFAAIPTPLRISEDVLRIYCSFCDKDTISRIGYVDVNARNPAQIISVSQKPVLDIGIPGMFDDNGVVPTSILQHENKIYLYYNGFQLGVGVRYYLFGGVAISADGGNTFYRPQQTPLIDRSPAELFFRTAHHVIVENGIWKMWYTAGSSWVLREGKQVPTYVIKYMESADGFTWPKEGRVCLHLAEGEHGFGRPYVIKENGLYRMFYSIRRYASGYRLGYAESKNEMDWTRKDEEIGITVSSEGWDSQAVCYSAVTTCFDKTYLFYSGNESGKTGFGYAELIT